LRINKFHGLYVRDGIYFYNSLIISK